MRLVETDIEKIVDQSAAVLRRLAGSQIVIAGAGGFLGRYFLEVIQLYNQNSDLKISLLGLDNFVSSTDVSDVLNYRDTHVSLQILDVCAPIDFSNYPSPDFIINAGGIASPHYYRAKPLATIDVSTIGSKNLLSWAHDCGARYIFFSSSEIYGDPLPEVIPIKETYRGNVSTLGPRACYDESKRLGETLCYVYSNNFDVHTSIIRPFNVYGPGMMKHDYRVMPNFARQILAGDVVTVYGSGSQTRTFCYVTDAMNGFFDVIALGGDATPYNVGCEKPEITMSELAKMFLSHSPESRSTIEMSVYPQSYPGDEPLRRCPDISQLRGLRGFEPKVSLDEGLSKYLSWAREVF